VTVRGNRYVGRLIAPSTFAVLVFLGCLTAMLYYSFLPSLGMARVGEGFTLASYWAFLGDAFNLAYLWRSLWIATYTTLIVLALAYPVAYFMSYCSARTRVVVSVLLLVQFFTSYVIRTYAVVLVLGRYGIVNRILTGAGIIDRPATLLFTEFAVALGLVVVAIPFMVFPIYGSIAAIPPNLIVAAKSLGATRAQIFAEVVLPLSLPGVAAGVIIVYLFNLTAFITPNLLGGGYFDMIANFIYDRAMNTQEYPLAAAAAMVSLVLTVVLVYLLQKGFGAAIKGAAR
jgi:ABC-type spermidine/putrescine transport system permease subunit I